VKFMPAERRPAAAKLATKGVLAALILTASPVATTAARADDCSGIMCLFHSNAPQQPPAAAAAPVAAPATAEAAADPAPKAKPRAKPVPVVTIAADPSEAARLKPIAAAVSRPRVKIVDAKAGKGADFSLSTSLDQGGGAGKARLYPEAMHVIAGEKVHSFADLKGKNVSFGADGSAGQTVARKAFQAAGVSVAETPLELDNALDGLATGDIDAVVVLAPQPDARLTKLHAPNLHLVAWPEAASLPDGASATTIDAQAYPGFAKQEPKVAALAVDAVLVESPKGAHQPAAKAFLGALTHHAAVLGKRGFALLEADAGRRVANNDPR
jgi:hypothetical protein